MSQPATLGNNALRLTPSEPNQPRLFVVPDLELPRPAPLRLTRRGKVVILVLVAAVLTALSLGLALGSSQPSASSDSGLAGGGAASVALVGSPETVVVQPGDTLWSIARQVAPNADPRAVVDEIIAANHLSGAAVQAGQQLVLPS